MKPIVFTDHALQRMKERNTNKEEVETAIKYSKWEIAERNRFTCSFTFQFKKEHYGRYYNSKEVVPVLVEEKKQIVVITVYTYFSQKEV